MSSPTILEVKDLGVRLDNRQIIKNITFTLSAEEVLAIIGPNGSGKSVLLKTLIGLLPATAGSFRWNENIKIGYIPQRLHLDHYLPMSVREFLSLKPNVSEKDIAAAFALIKIDDRFASKNLAKLSSGELQKVLIAWAIADRPAVLILDEPTENVDVVGQHSIYELLHELQDSLGLAIIIVSHDLGVVYHHANTVLCLNENMVCYGEPVQVLTAEVLNNLYGHHSFFHHHHQPPQSR